MRVKTLTFSLAAMFVINSSLWGWGNGHDFVNHFAVDVLPVEIRDFLGSENCRKVVKWSHAPDDYTPWAKLEKKYASFSEKEKELISKYKLKTIYKLHSHIGQAVNLIMLTQAFKDKNPERAALWMACILHTYADEAACNHDPLIHFMTYNFAGGYKMKFNKGVGFDFGDMARTPEGKKVALEMLKNYRPQVISKDPQKVLVKIMLGALESNSFMTQRGRRIAASYAQNVPPETWKDGQKAMAELGCYGIEHGVNAIVTAWAFAKEDKIPQITDNTIKEYQAASQKFMAERLIEHDSLFEPFVNLPIPRKPYTGFLIEPSISMASSKLSMASKLILSSAMRSMKKAGRPFMPLDYRSLNKKDLPTPAQMPVLVVNAKRHFSLPKKMKDKIKNYCDEGGKLLWIGGSHGKMLGDFSKFMQKVDHKQVPVSHKYGKVNSDIVAKSIIAFDGSLKTIMGNKEYKFTHDPETRAGWMKPVCEFIIDKPDKNIEVLATLTIDGKRSNIAGAWLDKNGKAKYIFLPEYLVSPFLFADIDTVKDPANIQLDDFVKKLLFGCLDILKNK